jgi:uncharacterized membrane protein SpoIIM required for sporulation/uncharacterized RDD family membrane protein YckC
MSEPTLTLFSRTQVLISLPIAGIGSRMLAYCIDVAVLSLSVTVIYFALTFLSSDLYQVFATLSGNLRLLIGMLTAFGLWIFWTTVEVRTNGQSVGKRLMHLRVVRLNGQHADALQFAVRNALRVIDFFPACYPVGSLFVLFERQHRRVGDLLAGTVVIREESFDLSRYRQPVAWPAILKPEQVNVLSSFFERIHSFTPEARQRLAMHFMRSFRLPLTIPDDALASLRAACEEANTQADHAALRPHHHGAETIDVFVRRRKPSWDALDTVLNKLSTGHLTLPELLHFENQHRLLAADLTVARKLFPGTDVDYALNQLLARCMSVLHRPQSDFFGSVRDFFAFKFPQAVAAQHVHTKLAAAILAGATAVAALAVMLSPDSARLLVSEELLGFISRKELWTDGILDTLAPAQLSTLIFSNNLRVALSAFALGCTAGIGSAGVLLYNGLHLGAVLGMAAQHGLLIPLLGFMAAHGGVELSIIALCGGAGLRLGHAILVPSNLSRSEAAQTAARDGFRVFLGCAPFLIAVGVIEGFVSPGGFFPFPVRALFGAASTWAFLRYLKVLPPLAPKTEDKPRLRLFH